MPTWTTVDIDGEVDLRMEAEGPGSWEPRTVFQVLEETVNRYNDRPALRYKREGFEVRFAWMRLGPNYPGINNPLLSLLFEIGFVPVVIYAVFGQADTPDGWTTVTWAQYYGKIMAFGKALLALGFNPHGAINIVGGNAVSTIPVLCDAIMPVY